MCPTIPRSTIRKSLRDKGFQPKQGRKHELWYLWMCGKRTAIKTRVSRGTQYKDYGDDLLSEMKRQLRLPNLSSTTKFLKCPITGAEYLSILREQGTKL